MALRRLLCIPAVRLFLQLITPRPDHVSERSQFRLIRISPECLKALSPAVPQVR